MKFLRAVLLVALIGASNTSLLGTPPPRGGGPMPDAFLRLQQQRPRALTYKRALMPWLSRVLRNRAAMQNFGAVGLLGNMAALEATTVQGSPLIAGTRNIPVLLIKYSNTSGDEAGHPIFASSILQRKLFDGDPHQPGGTIGDFYREMSYGQFTVRGTVYDWKALSQPDTFYEGKDYQTPQGVEHCNGLCDTAKLPDLIREALDLNPDIDWAQYDNDGPDGVPNSGDDDGFVDFVAFAHAEHGAECDSGTNIWSHRSSLSSWPNSEEYTTKSRSASGGFIKIDDYTIQPAYGCDGAAPNDIGVFAHEFGHAFGLPDLYDTSGRGEGLGNWCLMAGGAWGGDGQSPNQPVQMSAWAKELLGWVIPKDITTDTLTSIATFEDHADVYRVTISPTQYYLIDNLGKRLSNSRLPTAGLQIFRINQPVVNAGLRSNRVNYDPDNYGVDLIEADGLRNLHRRNFRGGPGDLFPGSTGNTKFDGTTNPKNLSSGAICQIIALGDLARAHMLFSSGLCPAAPVTPQPPAPQNNSADATPPQQPVATSAKVSDILSNPARYQSRVVQIVGRLENKGANIQLRKGRDFQLTDSSGSISVRLPLPLEIGTPRGGSDKVTLGDVLDETVRVLAIVETDSTTGRPRLQIKDAVILKNKTDVNLPNLIY